MQKEYGQNVESKSVLKTAKKYNKLDTAMKASSSCGGESDEKSITKACHILQVDISMTHVNKLPF